MQKSGMRGGGWVHPQGENGVSQSWAAVESPCSELGGSFPLYVFARMDVGNSPESRVHLRDPQVENRPEDINPELKGCCHSMCDTQVGTLYLN